MRDKIIKRNVKKNNDIIYGARAMKKQMGFLGASRETKDYDIYTDKMPKGRARELKKKLNDYERREQYYTKPAFFPGTHKVMDKGLDMKKGTRDDFGIADFSKKPRGLKTTMFGGVKYAHIDEVEKDRVKSLKDKDSSFRHEKDRFDLGLIRMVKSAKRFGGKR